MPYRRGQGRLWGPGVLDMKSGIAFFLHAVRALHDLDLPVQRKLSMLLVSDEEVGSKHSRALTEAEAKESSCVLVLEPGSNMMGELKTARKGIAGYCIRVEGKAAHAGIDFNSGANAVVELARQIDRVAGFTDLARGTTVNVGVIRGGTRTNVIPAEAQADIDVRVVRAKDAVTIDRKMHALHSVRQTLQSHVEGGLNRPPMERSKAVVDLFQRASAIGNEPWDATPRILDGWRLGRQFHRCAGSADTRRSWRCGEGAHAINESILINRIADRTALLAGLLSGL